MLFCQVTFPVPPVDHEQLVCVYADAADAGISIPTANAPTAAALATSRHLRSFFITPPLVITSSP